MDKNMTEKRKKVKDYNRVNQSEQKSTDYVNYMLVIKA